MAKTQTILTYIEMKKQFIKSLSAVILLVAAFIVLGGCEKKKNFHKWECLLPDDTTIITLDMYDGDNKYYSYVSPQNSMVLFQNEQWVYYKMVGDTLKVIKRGDNDTLPEMAHSNDLWLVFRPSSSTMKMIYIGIQPAHHLYPNEYTFNLKK